MENNKGRLTCEQVKKYDMVDYLSELGIEPKHVKGNNFWYISPFRDERTPSFKIDRLRNIWADFGEVDFNSRKKCAGGNLIDFAIRYHKCSVSEFLYRMEKKQGFPIFPIPEKTNSNRNKTEDDAIVVVKDMPLAHRALLAYIGERRIPLHIAQDYCREVNFKLHDKEYFAVGFKNNLGGFELRNKFFKGSSSPKSPTHIVTGESSEVAAVFEGFFDFLTYVTLIPKSERASTDYLILNSTVFFESARKILETYKSVDLYLDHNSTGRKVTEYALSLDKNRYLDKSALYKNYEDFNSLLCQFGKSQNRRNRLSP